MIIAQTNMNSPADKRAIPGKSKVWAAGDEGVSRTNSTVETRASVPTMTLM